MLVKGCARGDLLRLQVRAVTNPKPEKKPLPPKLKPLPPKLKPDVSAPPGRKHQQWIPKKQPW